MSVRKLSERDEDESGDAVAGLLARVAGHDRLAFHELYLCSSARLFAIALALTRDRQVAAEALQEAMLQIWQKAGRYDAARGTPESWMAGIVRFRAFDLLAHGDRRGAAGNVPDPAIEIVDEAALERLENTSHGVRLKRCLDRLEQKNRQSILLAYVHGYSHSQIASQLEIPLGTIKAWIRRGLTSLKTCLSS